MGGEHTWPAAADDAAYGSSPRGRGTSSYQQFFRDNYRFIPAWAGNIIDVCTMFKGRSVHPRVGGEHFFIRFLAILYSGSSPRGRGTCQTLGCLHPGFRFIPAWAGNIHNRAWGLICKSVHPRVGGEHRFPENADYHDDGSSPRGRGTCRPKRDGGNETRFIPAWAGNIR